MHSPYLLFDPSGRYRKPTLLPQVEPMLKEAASTQTSRSLSGVLYASRSGWVLLSVPNGLVRGIFSALDEPGIELPPSGPDNQLNAHISVMRPEELERIGGATAITERGKRFRYGIKGFAQCQPAGWDEMQQCWMLTVDSPELKALRRSYGLTSLPNNDKFEFHITCAVRRKKVLQTSDVVKATPVAVETD